jgi:hemoglobin
MIGASVPQNGTETAAEVAIYDRIGGDVAIDRLVEAFYGNMDALPDAGTIRAMHGPHLDEIKRVLKRYLSEWTGGPKLYSPEKGHPRLRQRHMPFPIDNAARDAWMACMVKALDDVLGDTPARQELQENMRKLADWMRNSG